MNGVSNWGEDPYPRAGGICGRNSGNIELSFNKANINLTTELEDPCIGGICAIVVPNGKILNCYNRGSFHIDFLPKRTQTCAEFGGICGLVRR